MKRKLTQSNENHDHHIHKRAMNGLYFGLHWTRMHQRDAPPRPAPTRTDASSWTADKQQKGRSSHDADDEVLLLRSSRQPYIHPGRMNAQFNFNLYSSSSVHENRNLDTARPPYSPSDSTSVVAVAVAAAAFFYVGSSHIQYYKLYKILLILLN